MVLETVQLGASMVSGSLGRADRAAMDESPPGAVIACGSRSPPMLKSVLCRRSSSDPDAVGCCVGASWYLNEEDAVPLSGSDV